VPQIADSKRNKGDYPGNRMTLKSIIVDVLNKLFSDYVENVDVRQINISLLGKCKTYAFV
jgi:hypothetical protein